MDRTSKTYVQELRLVNSLFMGFFRPKLPVFEDTDVSLPPGTGRVSFTQIYSLLSGDKGRSLTIF